MKSKSYIAMLFGSALVALSLSGCPITFGPISETYSVSYYGNGYTGTMPRDSKSYKYGDSATVLEAPERADYTFTGWEKPYGGLLYQAGETVYVDSNISFQAKWRFNGSLFITKEADDGVLTITGYNGEKGIPLAVPSQIGGKPVRHIGNDAFSMSNTDPYVYSYLYVLSLPEGILTIGERAFYFNSLTSLAVPSTVTSIGANAFDGNSLTTISLPEGVIVGTDAFKDNPLVDITIGNDVAIEDGKTFGQYGKAFLTYYIANGKAAGTYIYHDGEWGVWSTDIAPAAAE